MEIFVKTKQKTQKAYLCAIYFDVCDAPAT